MSKAEVVTVSKAEEAMAGIDVMTTEAMTIIVKAITNRHPMSESW
jgi:hypothetical protein